MHYSDNAVKEIEKQISEIRFKYYNLTTKVAAFAGSLRNERAKEYILRGVNRRLGVLYKCIENIFALFPANQIEKLDENARIDLEINLHAFLINTYGIIENIGLALAYENEIVSDESDIKLQKNDIGLFKKKFKRQLNSKLEAYLNTSGINSWYNEYAKNYRDALAHRIPPYVPPVALNDEEQDKYRDLDRELSNLLNKRDYCTQYEKILDKQTSLGISSPFYVHSFSEKAKLIYLHPQIIADFNTIEELIETAIENFYCNYEND